MPLFVGISGVALCGVVHSATSDSCIHWLHLLLAVKSFPLCLLIQFFMNLPLLAPPPVVRTQCSALAILRCQYGL